MTDYKAHYLDEREVKRVKFFHGEEVAEEVVEDGVEEARRVDSGEFGVQIRSVVGDIEGHEVEKLKERSNGDVENAVNLFFDGSFNREREMSEGENEVSCSQECQDLGLVRGWQKRYIGSFQAECLATRSGTSLLRYGEKLTVKRVHPSNKIRLKSRNAINSHHEDYVVRLANEQGSEIARLSEQDARFASVLIDCGLCYFAATGIFAEERVRIGDYMVVQVDCYMLRSAFFADVLPPSLNQTQQTSTKYFHDNSLETPDDKQMRLRQLGLANLFNKLDIQPKPVYGSSEALPTLETPDLVKATEAMGAPAPTEEQQEEEKSREFGQDELDALYKRAEPPDSYLEEVEPPADMFRLELRPYQKKGLNWMLQKETAEDEDKGHDRNEPMHPLWQAFSWPSQLEHMDEQVADKTDTSSISYEASNEFYVNLYSGELSLLFPRQQKSVLGGILADEMGLGKTISTMALVHSNKYRPNMPENKDDDLRKDFAKHTTLVVAPISLLAQWESEAYAASQDGSIRALIYYGGNTGSNLKQLLCGKPESQVPNIVITSYGTLLSEHNRLLDFMGKPHNRSAAKQDENWFDNTDLTFFGLYGVKFYRVVLDEAHTIRNRSSKTSKACYDLRARRRWVLTGTPIVNKLEDLYSIVKFLGVQPWNNFSFWRAFITAPFESKGYVQAMNVVQSVMEPLVLRRTKDMKQKDGTPLVQLPPKTVTIQRIKFSKDEHDLYQYVFARVKSSFKTRLKQGSLMSSYSAMLTQILRLRQVCCHPALVTSAALYKDNPRDLDDTATGKESDSDSDGTAGMFDLEDQDFRNLLDRFKTDQNAEDEKKLQSYGNEVMKQILEGAENECPICTTEPIPPEQQAVTECWHMSCLDCLIEHIEVSENHVILWVVIFFFFQKKKQKALFCFAEGHTLLETLG
ncbi:hypothetical protein TRICI_004593 [Trichomonascus ciferrii]|uniref:DNA repair protein RAD5 n=1 Tax=Trichomonascus ciferrii TaxID=44093 RepID=A0A642V1X9_9ASCO|nr:hypothetical protein TRICI_004593 [Trichomonascus ciferrii]